MTATGERRACRLALHGASLALLLIAGLVCVPRRASAQVYAEQLRTRGFGWDLQLQGGVGFGVQRALDNAFVARARLGGLYAYEPWILNVGPTLELGGLARLGAGAELELNSFGGLFGQLALARVEDDAWMTRIGVGFTIFGAEWQHCFAAGPDDDAIMFVVRVPLGIWWFLVHDDEEKTKDARRRASAGAPTAMPRAQETREQNVAVPAGPSADDRIAAQKDIERGREHTENGRHALAAEAFAHAYQLDPDPLLLLLVADAELAHGALVAASQTLRRFLSAASSGEAAQKKAEVQAKLDALLPRLAQLRLSFADTPVADEVRVEVDGQPALGALLGYDVPLDPGAHELRVTRGAEVVLERSLRVAEGEVLRIDVPPRSAR